MRMGLGKWTAVLLAAGAQGLAANAWAQQPAAPQTQNPGPAGAEPVPEAFLHVTPGGLTNTQVGERAAATSYSAKAQVEVLHGAAARVDEAWVAFLPRLTGTASYTRLSNFTPPSFGGGSLVGTNAPPGLISNLIPGQGGMPSPGFATTQPIVSTGPLIIPLVLDNYLLQASLAVPIRAQSAADGRVAFYSWLGARGAVIVAVRALGDQKAHLTLARNQFEVGQASKADVLRAETNVASAELQVVHAKNLAELAEKQVRVAMHAKDEENLAPGESLDVNPPPFQGNLRELTNEAATARPEVRSIDANALAAREQAKAAHAAQYPALTGFADAVYANPNPRRFPQTADWFPTWDIGARLVWSPNDTLIGGSNVTDLESRAAQLEAQKGTLRDNIEIEVTQSYQAVREADVSLDSAKQELSSAEEAYRVTKELFNNGRATSTTLTDSETELTRARLDLLNAQVSARTARVRLDHALGRDARLAEGP
jgi:outer membrane protein TolC